MFRTNPASRVSSTLICVLALIATCACQFDPYTLSYAKTRPNVKDIVGFWEATERTLRDLSGTKYSAARPTISIASNGTIKMKDIPDAWRDDLGEGKGTLDTFVGKWQLDKHQDWWGLEIRRGDWGCTGCLMILDQAPPYHLVIRVGDPDLGIGYEFRRAG